MIRTVFITASIWYGLWSQIFSRRRSKILPTITCQYTILDIIFRNTHKISQKVFRLGPNPILNPAQYCSLLLAIYFRLTKTKADSEDCLLSTLTC